MFFVICAIIAVVLAILILGNAWENNGSRSYPKWEKFTMPVWAWILIFLACLTPIISAIAILVFMSLAIRLTSEGGEIRGPIGGLIKLLVKRV